MDHMQENFPDIKEILCPGDLTGYGPAPTETIEAILENKKITKITKGNHDHAIGGEGPTANVNPKAQEAINWQRQVLSPELKRFLYQLPHHRICFHQPYKETQIYIIHGSPSFPLDEYILPGTGAQQDLFPFMELFEVNILLLGHTHVPFIDKQQGELEMLMVNPGSIGQPRDKDPRASYAVIDVEEMNAEIIRVDYDIDAVIKEMNKVGLPEFLSDRLKSGI